jgi:hypothetical protein
LIKFEKETRGNLEFVYVFRKRTAESKHKFKKSILYESFFKNSKTSLGSILEILYFWADESTVKQVVSRTGNSKPTVIQWFQYFRDVCTFSLLGNPIQFGGPNCIVQIDESKFMNLLHHRGEPRGNVREGWIFGIYDVSTKNVHFELVPDRTQETIFPIIQRVVRPETTIFSDEFATYTGGPNNSYNFTPLAF